MTIAAIAGALLAIASVQLNIMTGWIGGLALILWAVLARKNWAEIQTKIGLEPSGPERVLRLRAAGTALLLGHLIAALLHPGLDIHVGQGNSLAIDSWMMIAAYLLTGLLFRRDEAVRDERNDAITAKGTGAGYVSLIGMLIVLLSVLGTLSEPNPISLSYFTLANILVAIVLSSIAIKYTVQLIEYAKDTDATTVGGDEE